MVRRIAPRHGVDPGPAPRCDIGPVSVAVRRPAHGHVVRIPHGAVVAVVLPVAVLVQVLVADHLRRDVLAAARLRVALVALLHPGVESVAAVDVADRDGGEVGVDEAVAAPGEHVALRVVFAVHGGPAVEHGDAGLVAVDVHAHAAGLIDHQRHGGRVDLVALALLELAHAEAQRALGQFDLGQLVVQVEQAHVGALVEPQGGAAQFEFGAGIVAAGELVAGGQRAVDAGVAPVAGARRQQAEFAAGPRQPGHPAGRRIAVIVAGGLRMGEAAAGDQQHDRQCRGVPRVRGKQFGQGPHDGLPWGRWVARWHGWITSRLCAWGRLSMPYPTHGRRDGSPAGRHRLSRHWAGRPVPSTRDPGYHARTRRGCSSMVEL